jgi:FAD/FMN-containing dehydrogenase
VAIDERTFRGRVLRPDDPGYDVARRVFNAMIDRRPALIVACAGADDVATGIRFARERGLPISVKGGGHSVAGTAVCDDGLLLDLSTMKRAAVDPDRRTATVAAGLTLGELDEATSAHGLATPTGVVSVTGLSGLALGGGLGWLNGLHGLTCDNVISIELVTADGELVVASAEQHPDLFWALRGGGGNFGVATTFTFDLHPVGDVLGGGLTYPASRAAAVLRAYHEAASAAPDELTMNASIWKTEGGEVAVSIGVCHVGSPVDADRLLEPLRRLGPVDDAVAPMPYRTLQQANDQGYPPGRQHYWKSGSLTEIHDDAIALLVDRVAGMPSEASGVGLQQLHGAAARVDPTATAYPHRAPRYDCLILSQWADPGDTDRNLAWTRDLHDDLQPFFAGGVYVNNLGNEGDERVRQAYGPNYERLVAVKTAYDPTNVFRHNQNIPPAAQAGTYSTNRPSGRKPSEP